MRCFFFHVSTWESCRSVHPSLAGGCRTCQFLFAYAKVKAWTVLMDGPGPGCRDIVPATFSSTGCCNMCVLSPMVQYGVAKSLRKSLKYAWEVTPWWLAFPRLPGEHIFDHAYSTTGPQSLDTAVALKFEPQKTYQKQTLWG